MRGHWVLGAAALLAAGCGAGATGSGGPPSGGGSPHASHSTATSPPATSPPATSAAYPMPAGPPLSRAAVCGPIPAPSPHSVAAIQFVSAAAGFAAGPSVILATTDGGRTWQRQLTGQLNLAGLDFVSATTGWAVGPGTLLATTNGGRKWAPLTDPCLRSVHFVSPATGYAIAGGSALNQFSSPATGGQLAGTTDGGHTWHQISAPANAQSVCFGPGGSGWLGAGGRLYRSADGGSHWQAVTAPVRGLSSGFAPTTQVQCAGQGVAWAELVGPGAASSQQPHIGYFAGPGARPLFAEQYFPHPGIKVSAQAPSSYAGALSAISPSTAAFVDWCPACGQGVARWDLISGSTLTRKGTITGITLPEGASFLSPDVGWVSGMNGAAGRIVATTNGGRTWQVQYRG